MSEYVVVGRIGPAFGIRGESYVEPRTDEPERRFAEGAVLRGVRNRDERDFTVVSRKDHQGKMLIRFEGVDDRNTAETLRGFELRCAPSAERPDDPEEFYDHQLIGLAVVTTDGTDVGTLKEIQHHAQDLLVISTGKGQVLVPFVAALVPEVDLEGGRIVVADRPGLLNPEQAS